MSNFCESKFEVEGQQYKTVEHYYQQKCRGLRRCRNSCTNCPDRPSSRRKTSCQTYQMSWRRYTTRNIVLDAEIMTRVLEVKLMETKWNEMLLNTSPKTLIECNQNDKVFGIGLSLSKLKFHVQWLAKNL